MSAKQITEAFLPLLQNYVFFIIHLSKSQLSSLRLLNLKLGRNLDLKILEPNNDTVIECAFIKLFDYTLAVKTSVFDASNLRGNIKGKCFDLRLSHNYSLKKAINLFANREEFTKYKGYDAMLYAFKCKKMPNFGDDPDINKFMPLYK
uniref:Uncharacterized protein n=1 Tax=Meloidogyne javanica TaxID=6303 RepID=A0A915LKJ5_MELJA